MSETEFNQVQDEYRGPGYTTAALGKGATYGAVTGAVAGAAAVGTDIVKSEAGWGGLLKGKDSIKPAAGRVWESAKTVASNFGQLFKKTPAVEGFNEISRLNKAVVPVAVAAAAIGAVLGLRNVARAKGDQETLTGDAVRLSDQNNELRMETQAMAEQMEQVVAEVQANARQVADTAVKQAKEMNAKAEAVSAKADAVAEKVVAHKQDHAEKDAPKQSHAEKVEASREEAEAASLAV